MSIIETCNKNTDNPVIEDKIRSSTHRFEQTGNTALSGYSVSINTIKQTWHSGGNTPKIEKEVAISRALELGNIIIQPKSTSDIKDNVITFYLSKDKGNYRSEISNFRPVQIDAKSTYSFKFKATSLPKTSVLFQVREMGGSMKNLGGDRPSFSIHIKDDGTLTATTNTINKNPLPNEPDGNTYQNKKIILTKIEPHQFHEITLDIVMHPDSRSIKAFVNNEVVLQYNSDFGAPDSTRFYSKLGAYVPQQKKESGISDTEISFDDIKEEHYKYNPQEISKKINYCLMTLENNALSEAVIAFPTGKNSMVNMIKPNSIGQLLLLGTSVISHSII
ncbi:heparin lyase I family protein [Yersinia enterocolitica]|uniref:heparin lyase I family protein n=1 Tax=Yersinia enterocolitica TaxID=630 RepID=UPI0005E0C6BD|nr:heparin lyase I family protein [Yersinia enterocolitica]MBW5819289.1 hypothetical protein [Yersinia enterocolitica]MBW5849651.1 hypothetical protein [Yersinia enterocolitica]MBW5866725.1 hypothetical protein [Yersinia enterocolitica]MBW5875707.1 hypothetical protein [Yersinia enterocolitica]CNK45284.1 Uncharacterised protein [Yersinia enterocolitica]